MKKGIHPEWHKNAKVLVNGKEVMSVGSTLDELNVEIWSGTHPFYTGKETVVDLDNKIDSFKKRIELAQNTTARNKKEKRRARKASSIDSKKPVTLRDILKQAS
jgi:large subunit ribosomal protein L31